LSLQARVLKTSNWLLRIRVSPLAFTIDIKAMPPEATAWQDVRETFRRIWGYEDFRPPQGEIVNCLLEGQDALVVMPTGGGKSICFQLPALLRQGLTLVISPLVALMENQVAELRQKRLPAALLHSQMPRQERWRCQRQLEQGQLRLLYLSPETLLSPKVWSYLCQPEITINGLVLDEAHCLVQWGETFRPAYRRMGAVRAALQAHHPGNRNMAIAAFTATADPRTQATLRDVLQLRDPKVFLISPYRQNLDLGVKIAWTPRCRRHQIKGYIQRHPGQSGLVYVRTRRDGEVLAQWLTRQGLGTMAYHGGLSPQQRRQIEHQWLEDHWQFVVCTSAFGMGINKPQVRWVIHFQAPLLLSEYVQEVGRAGRDRQPATAITFVSEPTGWLDPSDRQRQQFFQDQMRSHSQLAQRLVRHLPQAGDIQTVSQHHRDGAVALALLHSAGQLTWRDPFHYVIRSSKTDRQVAPTQMAAARSMGQYLYTRGCRWQFLLQAFGFVQEARNFHCGHCDRCASTNRSRSHT